MRRFALVLAFLAAVSAGRAVAQAPHAKPTPAGTSRKVPVSGLENPGNHHGAETPMSGRGCISGPTAAKAQTAVNPITGKRQSQPIVQVPLGKGGPTVAEATTHAQRVQACAHPH